MIVPRSSGPWSRSVVLACLVFTCGLSIVLWQHNGMSSLVLPASLTTFQTTLDHSKNGSAPQAQKAALETRPASSGGRNKTKVIVTSVQKKDESTTDWILDLLPDWEPYIFVTDRRSEEEPIAPSSRIKPASLLVNRGREASVYLTYIVQHYYHLPDYMVFIHGKRYQIHNDDPMLDTFPEISRLNLDYVEEQGYTSLRCNWMHCPKAQVEPELGYDDGFWDTRGLYAQAWTEFFPNETIPAEVTGPCCAQFAVTRETVQRWPIDKYEQIRQWMWSQEGDQASMKSGLVLEYMWHILFGKPAYSCENAQECYCKKWGLCDLECEDEGWCLGRIWLNPKKNPPLGLPQQIPVGWPEHGQPEGTGDGSLWPYEGWWEDPEVRKYH